MKILVIGQSGQVATSLAERARGHAHIDLVTTGRDQIDLELPETIARAIAEHAPDLVINAAAYTAVDDAEDDEARAYAVNATGAGAAARAAREAGARFIHISTDYVFDGSGADARSEDAPTAPLGVYGRSKRAGEKAVREASPAALIIRTAWLYSPFGKNFAKTMIALAQQRDELRVVADQRGNPTSALDLADGLLAAAEVGWTQGDLYHLAGTGDASWAEFASATMEECERLGLPSARVVSIESADYPTRAHRPRNSMLDSGRFKKAFGFAMPHWRESLAAVVDRLVRD